MPPRSLLLMALWPTAARAQGGPEVHVQHTSGMSVEAINGTPLASADTRLGVSSAGLSTPLPPLRLFEQRWAVIPVADFEYTRLRVEGASLTAALDHDLYRARVGLLNVVQATAKLGFVALVQPGFYTDFGGRLSTDDVGLTALALGTWAASESLSLGVGGGYVLFFGRPRWVPFGQVEVGGDRVEIDVLLPRVATAWWNAAGPVWVGAEAEIDGGFYRLHPDAADEIQAVFQEYSRSRVGVGARVQVRDALIFELVGAVTPRTRATVYVDADTPLFDYELSPGWTVAGQVSLGVDR